MFETWADRVATVNESESRRALLAEIAVWRARRLTDVPATRQATWALAKIHQALGDAPQAVQEAQQLMSLCQTAPLPSREQGAEARRLLSELGVKPPNVTQERRERPERSDRSERRERPERGPRAERAERAPRGDKSDPVAQARVEAEQGRTRNVRKIAADRRGAVWTALRGWSVLTDGLQGNEAALRAAAAEVLAELEGLAGLRRAPAARTSREDDVTSGPLVELLGRSLPSKRRAALSVAEGFLADNPGKADLLGALMLDNHVATSGPDASASWLSGLLARAMVAGGEQTKARLLALQTAGASGVALFDALPFHRSVRLATSAAASGWSMTGLREGVLSRGEPADRRVWTLRIHNDSGQRMLAVAPHATEAWTGTLAADIAARIAQLAPSAVLLATGGGNAALRTAAEGAGVQVLSEDGDDAAILEVLAAREPIAVRERTPASDRHAEAPSSDGPSPPEQLAALLAGTPSEAEIQAIVALFRRPSSALRVAERAEASLDLAPALLRAVHEASDADRTVPEGTTLAIRAAASGNTEARALLTSGPTAARFGGPGAGGAADVGAALVSDGWELFRVLRGTTRRERERQPVLETLGEALDGLWRLLVRKGDVKGEVWFLAEVGPEGRAGVPQLLQEEHQRAVIVPANDELASWYGTLGAPEAVLWSGTEADAVRAAVGAWTA